MQFKNPPVLDGQVLPCTGCAGPELPYGVYDVTYAVATGLRRFGPETTVRIELRDYLVVSLGDSLASGEGAPDESGEYEYEFEFLDKLDVISGGSVNVTEKKPVGRKD